MNTFLLGLIAIGGLFLLLSIFLRPTIGLVIIVFMVYIRLSDVLFHFHGIVSLAKFLYPILAIIVFLRWTIFNERPNNVGTVILFLITFAFLGLISLLYAGDSILVLETLDIFWRDAITVLIIVTLMRKTESIKPVIWSLIAGGIFLGSISTYQFLTSTFDSIYLGFAKATLEPGSGYFRLSGILLETNFYAQRLLVVVPLALDRLLNEKETRLQLIAGWALVVSILTIILTYSRGGFIGLVGVLLLMVLLTKRIWIRSLIASILVGMILVPFIPSLYIERIVTLTELTSASEITLIREGSFRGRLSENIVAWRMFADHPLLGVGLNNFKPNYLDYSRDLGIDSRLEERSPHSMYLQFMAEHGIFGLFWLIALIFVTFKGLMKAQKDFLSSGKSDYANISVAIGIAIGGFLITGIFLHLVHRRFFLLIFTIALSIPILANRMLFKSIHRNLFG